MKQPHRFPTPVPRGEILYWCCAACGELIDDGAPASETSECPVNWRAHAAMTRDFNDLAAEGLAP